MLLKELNYILAIEKYGTITKAAEHLYISQPALSKYIKTLEETLDTNLLENTGRSIILTDAGKHYAKAARKMMEIYETMSRNLLNSDNMIHGTLRIGTSFTRSPLLLPETLARFRQKYPNVELLLFEENSNNLETQLASGLIDFVIAKGPVTNIYIFTALPLFREEFLLGLPKDHPVKERAVRSGDAAHPWLGLQEVLNECFILLKPGHHTRFMADQFFAQSQFVPAKTIVTANIETALRMAVAGLGIVFVPSFFTIGNACHQSKLDFYSVGAHPLQRTYTEFSIMYRQETHLTKYAKEFIRIMQDYCREFFAGE